MWCAMSQPNVDDLTEEEAARYQKAVNILIPGALELTRLYGVDVADELIGGFADTWKLLSDMNLDVEADAAEEQEGGQ